MKTTYFLTAAELVKSLLPRVDQYQRPRRPRLHIVFEGERVYLSGDDSDHYALDENITQTKVISAIATELGISVYIKG